VLCGSTTSLSPARDFSIVKCKSISIDSMEQNETNFFPLADQLCDLTKNSEIHGHPVVDNYQTML